jgi:uncharacterized protein YdeI (YjbR/CyaY-like superfamily)
MQVSNKQPASEPVLPFATQRKFAAWLAKHHATASGIWIKIAKAASGIRSIKYAEAVEEALCWGWIDSQTKGIDENWYVQRFTPRGKRSPWSKINCAKATGLIAAGRMKSGGLAEVQRAKNDGRWDRAYDSPARATIPADLAAELTRNRRASHFFEQLDSINRYAILYRLQTATRPETRARRIDNFVKMLARKEKLHP